MLIFSYIFFFFLLENKKENKKENIFKYLSNGDKSYWKETFCIKDKYNTPKGMLITSNNIIIHIKKNKIINFEDDYLYIDKDTFINFEKNKSFKDLTFTDRHTYDLRGLKNINMNNVFNNYGTEKVFKKCNFKFQILNKNKFQIISCTDSLILHVFERVNKIPKIDTIESIKLKDIDIEYNKRINRSM